MAVDCLSDEGRIIRQLIPLATMSSSGFEALCGLLAVEEAENGQFLFRRGDVNTDLFYLLKGSVSLQIDALKIETIKAGSDSSRFPLAHQIPRKVNGVANSRIRFLRLNADMMKFAQDAPYEESTSIMIDDELVENDDWMTTLLKSPIFRVLPPANLQKILMSMEEINVNAGSVIISQGDDGDYYYIIKKGRCLISRKPAPNAKEIKLGQLSGQDSFGEDALISGQPRNVTITAISDVSLLRLAKDKFISLIKLPVLKYISYPEVQDMLSKGAKLIDVREPDDFKKSHLPESINVPYFSLRMQLKTLNRLRPVVVVCRNGKISETVAFVLIRHKFNALVLQGGIEALSEGQLIATIPYHVDESLEIIGNYSETYEEASALHFSEEMPSHDEIQHLHQLIHDLRMRYNNVQAEKNALEHKYSTLAKHVEALEAKLKTFNKG